MAIAKNFSQKNFSQRAGFPKIFLEFAASTHYVTALFLWLSMVATG
jgi:hypothetical protein